MADTPQPQPAPDPEPTPAPDLAPDPARTFSQADLDRIVSDRLARQKAQFADYDDLKTKAARLDEIEEQSKSELEKAQQRAAELERELSAAATSAQEERLRSAIVSEAAKRNVVDPDAAFALIDRAAITFDDDGYPTNIATAMDSLLEARGYLVAPQGGGRAGSADQGARGGAGGVAQLTREDLSRLTAEGKTAEIVKAQEEGRLADVLGGNG